MEKLSSLKGNVTALFAKLVTSSRPKKKPADEEGTTDDSSNNEERRQDRRRESHSRRVYAGALRQLQQLRDQCNPARGRKIVKVAVLFTAWCMCTVTFILMSEVPSGEHMAVPINKPLGGPRQRFV